MKFPHHNILFAHVTIGLYTGITHAARYFIEIEMSHEVIISNID